MSAPDHMRLDQRLVADGLVASRARARDLILRGFVRVDGAVCGRPAQSVAPKAAVTLDSETPVYVSRGSEKLIAALDAFCFDPAGRTVLDAGASTGGFTDALLKRAARHVYAVDVGTAQLHESLRQDTRVTVMENCDVRSLSPEDFVEPVEAIVADLSFISLTKALGPALALAAPGAFLVALIKPQFELTPADIGKGGIVRDEDARRRAIASVESFVGAARGWRLAGLVPSPIAGGSGNIEYLLGALKDV